MIRHTTRWTLWLLLLIVLGGGAWLASRPSILAPYFSRLVTRNLLRENGQFQFGDLSGSLLSDVELTDVSITLRGRNNALAIVGVDTLRLEYGLRELLRKAPRIRRMELIGAEILTRRGRSPETGADTAPASPFSLPALQCDDLVVEDSSFAMANQFGQRRQNVPILNWRGTLKTGAELVLVSRDSDIWWETHAGRIENLEGVIRVDHSALTFQKIKVRVNDRDYALSGRRDHRGALLLEVEARNASAADIEDLIDIPLGFQAEGAVDLTLTARRDTVEMEYNFDGLLEGYDIQDFTGRCRLVGNELYWRHMDGRINGARFSGTGDFDIADPQDLVMRLVGNVSDVDLSSGLVPDVDLPRTDGWGRLDLWRRFGTDETRVIGWLREGRLDTVPFDSVYVDISAVSDSVTFNAFDLHYDATTASLVGAADSSGLFVGRLDLDCGDLSGLPPEWELPALSGGLRASGRVEGIEPVFSFDGRAVLTDAGIATLRADTCRARLSISDMLGRPMLMASAVGSGLVVSEIPCGDFDFDGVVSADLAMLNGFHCERGDTSLAFRGQADFTDSLLSFYIPDVTLDLEGETWKLRDSLRFKTGADRLEIDAFAFESDLGSLNAELVWDKRADAMSGRVGVAEIDLAVLNPLLDTGLDLNGRCSGDFELDGAPSAPRISGRLMLVDSVYPLARIDTLDVRGRFGDGFVQIGDLAMDTDRGRVDLSGTVGAGDAPWREWWSRSALDLEIELSGADWAFMDQFEIPALKNVAGLIDGAFHVGGSTRRPEIEGGLTSTPFHIHWLHLDTLDGSLIYADDVLTLGDLHGRKDDLTATGRIEIPLVMDLMHTPVSPLDGPFYMSLDIPQDTPLTALSTATNAFVESGGYGGLSLVISGKAEHPYYSGEVSLRDGSCVIRGLSEVYHGISATGEWKGDVLAVDDIVGSEGARGTVRGDGEVRFSGMKLDGFAFDLSADRFLVASIPELRVLVRSDAIALDGVKVGPDSVIVPRFSGRAQVIRARYLGDFTEQPGAQDPLAGTVAPGWLADLDINAPPRTGHIINGTMELALGGQVRFVRDLEGMRLSGGLKIDQGRLPVFNNDFKVTSGNLDFSREAGVIPQVDIRAETSVRLPAPDGGNRRLEKIFVDMTGSAMAPQVEFSSESGYARNNIERMLLGLSPHATDTAVTSVIQKETISAGFNILEREVAQELDLIDTFDIESGRERVDGTTQTLIGVGKFLGQGLYVKFAQAVTDQDREVVMEYQLTDNLLLQSEISKRQDEFLGNTTYSIDLKYRYEY